jgi:hypothetical protein
MVSVKIWYLKAAIPEIIQSDPWPLCTFVVQAHVCIQRIPTVIPHLESPAYAWRQPCRTQIHIEGPA